MENIFKESERLLTELSKELKDAKNKIENSNIHRAVALDQLKEVIESYCKSNNLLKKDLAMLAEISSNTLNTTLKNPKNAKVSTIVSICQVIGVELTLTRG